MTSRKRIPIEELVDSELLARCAQSPRDVRALLPRGWVLDEDGRTAHREVRLLFRDGWVLLIGLGCFGAAAIGLFWRTAPAGWAWLVRLGLSVAVLLVVGGVVAPRITRGLARR